MVNAITSTRNGKNDYKFMTNKKNTSRSVETFSIFAVVFYEVELSIRFEVVDD